MTAGCILLVAGAGFLAFLIVVGGIIAGVVKKSLEKAADRALGAVVQTASGVAGQAMNRVVEQAVPELVKGAKDLTRSVSEDMKRKDPRWVTVQINGIAHRNRGEVTVAQAISQLSVTEEMAASVLGQLVEKKVCFVRNDAGPVNTYIFPGFKEKREVKHCEYCRSVFTDDADNICDHCGAPLKTISTMVD